MEMEPGGEEMERERERAPVCVGGSLLPNGRRRSRKAIISRTAEEGRGSFQLVASLQGETRCEREALS